jgi:hypothetical protein
MMRDALTKVVVAPPVLVVDLAHAVDGHVHRQVVLVPRDGVGEHEISLLEDMPGAVRDVVLATSIRAAARLTSDEKLSLALKLLGEQIVERAAGKGALFDDYCGTPVKPRPPRLSARTHV